MLSDEYAKFDLHKDTVGRRSRVDLYSPAEAAIRNAMIEVEKVGAHPLLTNSVVALARAQEELQDFLLEEHCMTCNGSKRVEAKNPSREKAWIVPCPDCSQ